ncbi:unnamed protein product, partial [marine sediment metagenome]
LSVPASGDCIYFMQKYIMDFLSSCGVYGQMDELGNIYIVKGKAKYYPCLTAHMDTVHRYATPQVVESFDEKCNSKVFTAEEGIGGDDKVGIFVCLSLLKQLDTVKIVFFNGEESGGTGSDGAIDSFFEDIGYMLAIDRNGNSDYVNNYLGEPSTTKKFDDKIKHILDWFGYKETTGMFTDVFNLKENEKIDVCGCNFSCGYYLSHTTSEYVVEREVYRVIRMILKMIKRLGHKKYEHTFEYSYSYKKYTSGLYGSMAKNTSHTKGY